MNAIAPDNHHDANGRERSGVIRQQSDPVRAQNPRTPLRTDRARWPRRLSTWRPTTGAMINGHNAARSTADLQRGRSSFGHRQERGRSHATGGNTDRSLRALDRAERLRDVPTPALVLPISTPRVATSTRWRAKRMCGFSQICVRTSRCIKALNWRACRWRPAPSASPPPPYGKPWPWPRVGVADILVANQVVGAARISTLTRVAALSRVTVAVDDRANLDELAAAARLPGARLASWWRLTPETGAAARAAPPRLLPSRRMPPRLRAFSCVA